MKKIYEKMLKNSRLIITIVLSFILTVSVTISSFAVSEKEITLIRDLHQETYITRSRTVGQFLNENNIEIKENERVFPEKDHMLLRNTVIRVYSPVTVMVIDDDVATNYSTTMQTVEEFLKEAKISVSADDSISVEDDDEIFDGEIIVITRAKKVTFIDGNKLYSIKTCLKTVGEAAALIESDIDEDDYMLPSEETKILNGMTIEIVRVTKSNTIKTVAVPYGTDYIETDELPYGEERKLSDGINGEAVQTIEVKFENGIQTDEKFISQQVVKEPVNEVYLIGTYVEPNVKVTATGETFKYKKVITCSATAYDASPASNGKWAGKSATGLPLEKGMVAVDPKVIPMYSKLYIESEDGTSWTYGYGVAGDTGGAIKGNKVDLFFYTSTETKNFGRRKCNVYVLE